MPTNVGKKFEERLEEDWGNSFPSSKSFIMRLPDQVSKRKGSSKNPCDFFAFDGVRLYVIEAKTHLGHRFPFDALPQYDKLKEIEESHYDNTLVGVVLWFRDHEKVLFIPMREIIKMVEEDKKKSINIKMFYNKEYTIYEIPSVKLRNYMKSDYSIMSEIEVNVDDNN